MARPASYLTVFTLPLAVAFTMLGASYLILHRLGEDISPLVAAEMQQTSDISYSSALFYRPRPYKIERARLMKADVVLLGSSRAMQFVGDPWLVPTYNAGGAMRDLESGEVFLNSVLPIYHPKRMIIALDWWWFSTTRRPDAPTDASPETPLTLHELIQPGIWIFDGTLSAKELSALLFSAKTPRPAIGLPAYFKHAGWNTFGHYDYGDVLSEQASGSDIGFEETLKDIQRTSKRNDRGPWNDFSEKNWQRLEAIVKRLQDGGTEVILFLPPIAEPLYDWLETQPEPNMVKEVRRRLALLPALTFDFHDPKTVRTNLCEFVDGMHGGEVTYLRILDTMAADPSADLEHVLDRARIQQLIAANGGYARLQSDDPTREPEADFNSLGCKK